MSQTARELLVYFCLVLVLTAPIWFLGAAYHFELLPGLPIGAISIICPTIAAVLVTLWWGGGAKVRALFSRVLDFKKAGWRLLAILLINPVLFGLAFLVSRLSGAEIPYPEFTAMQALMLSALFLPGAVFEEIGWTGFATDRLQSIVSPLAASVLLGLFWSIWHYPSLIDVGRAADWIAWWTLWTVSARMIMVWLYNNAGRSLLAMVVFHAMINLCWQLYPVNGSWFDPRISGLVTFGAALVLIGWSWVTAGNGRKSA